MKKLIPLLLALFFVGVGSMQAQDLLRVDDFTVIDGRANNISVQLKVADQARSTSTHLDEFQDGQKEGFRPSINADNTQLTLNFTKQFSRDELTKLLKYTEIELSGTAFDELYNLINQ